MRLHFKMCGSRSFAYTRLKYVKLLINNYRNNVYPRKNSKSGFRGHPGEHNLREKIRILISEVV